MLYIVGVFLTLCLFFIFMKNKIDKTKSTEEKDSNDIVNISKSSKKEKWKNIGDNFHGFIKHVLRDNNTLNLVYLTKQWKFCLKNIYHWKKDTELPPIIGSREVLYYLMFFNYNSFIIIENYYYSIEPNSNILCISNKFLRKFRKKYELLESRSKKDKASIFESIYKKKLSNNYVLPSKLTLASENKLAENIKNNMPYEKMFLEDDCSNSMEDIFKNWYEEKINDDNEISKSSNNEYKNFKLKTKMIYELTENEIIGCKKIVNAMTYYNTLSGSKGDKSLQSKKSQYDKSLQGVCSELGVSRILRTPIQIHHTYSRSANNDTFDGIFPNKKYFDVKSITRDNLPIIVTANKIKNPAHVYILAYVYDPTDLNNEFISTYKRICVEIKGFITKDKIFDPKNMKNNYYAMPQSELMEFKDIFFFYKKKKKFF